MFASWSNGVMWPWNGDGIRTSLWPFPLCFCSSIFESLDELGLMVFLN